MDTSTTYLGVVTKLQQKQGHHEMYVTAWLDSITSRQVYFQQNKLLDKKEGAGLSNGQLMFFEITSKPLEKGTRLDAVNAYLAWPAQIQDYFLALDAKTLNRLQREASPSFIETLIKEIGALEKVAAAPETQAKLAEMKHKLELQPKLLERVQPTPQRLEQSLKNDSSPSGEGTSSFLGHLLTANSPEYALKLFPLLVEGIKAIRNEDSFKQALFLLEFNNQLKEGQIPHLKAIFYALASRRYQFQFWLQNVVSYCDTNLITSNFTKGSDEVKQQILLRFQGITELLPAQNSTLNPKIESYFQGIKNRLLEELQVAQSTIQVAVAWFTNDELFAMLCQKLQQNIVVELIINNDYINNWEHGLPFDKFIELGGNLYLSEHPAMMHHKFCIIDDTTLFNGSYNWTYYAEHHNEENVLLIQNSQATITDFKAAFSDLKQRIGQPVKNYIRFDQSELPRFERISFRTYLSKEIQTRVTYIQAHRATPDVQLLSKLMDKAVEIDSQNKEAKPLQQKLAETAALDKHIVQSQQTVQQVLGKDAQAPSEPPVDSKVNALAKAVSVAETVVPDKPTTPEQTPVPTKPYSDKIQSASVLSPGEASVGPAVPPNQLNPQAPNAETNRPISSRPLTSSAGSSAPVTRTISATTNSLSKTPSISASASVNSPTAPPIVVDTSISIPETKRTKALFDDLQLVLAIDYSGSMESTHKLYTSGKIQKAINMLLGISKALTNNGTIDVFKFHNQAISLAPVTDTNYTTYVSDVVHKDQMGGTDIFAPIQAIHNKYSVSPATANKIFVILITDGENETKSNDRMKAYFAGNKTQAIFWQFVGLGASFAMLEEIARTATNTAFFHLNDVEAISNDKLLDRLLQNFPTWFEQGKKQEVVK